MPNLKIYYGTYTGAAGALVTGKIDSFTSTEENLTETALREARQQVITETGATDAQVRYICVLDLDNANEPSGGG